MSDVQSHLVALIEHVEGTVAPHDADCIAVDSSGCDCTRPARVRTEIARTIERIGRVMASYDNEGMCTHERSDAAEERWWAERWEAALRGATAETEREE